tara:strand:- start:70 stop:1206 length:1137 start_codon:yes stop_codon:yes gene_type:complete
MSDVAIKVENLSKKYRIGNNAHSTLRDTLSNLISKKKSEEFWALKDLNFEIKKGEAIGIIGRNGAGKSTLLKILSKITRPTTGRIEINGRVSSLLEVGTGFHPELTGRENVYLNGSLLGMSRSEIKSKFDEILDFSGVEKFIDTPVKHYSSGMYVRLAFSVAAHLNTEVLLVDEVLAVGDADFQKKCLFKMDEIAGIGKTVLFVSHNIDAIKKLTKKSLLINDGSLEAFSGNENVINRYYGSKLASNYRKYSEDSIIDSVEILVEDQITIICSYRNLEVPNFPHLGFLISSLHGEVIFGSNPTLSNKSISTSYVSSGKLKINIKSPVLNKGQYVLSIFLASHSKDLFIDEQCLTFSIPSTLNSSFGFVSTDCEFIINE